AGMRGQPFASLLAALLLSGAPCRPAPGGEPAPKPGPGSTDDRGGAVRLERVPLHPMRYYLSLPKGYRRSRAQRWPVLVCLAGADSDFRGLLERYRGARGGLPVLLVCPCTFSNTNGLRGARLALYSGLYPPGVIDSSGGRGLLPDLRARLDWDEEGVLALLDHL